MAGGVASRIAVNAFSSSNGRPVWLKRAAGCQVA
jgi:hypothetical protein